MQMGNDTSLLEKVLEFRHVKFLLYVFDAILHLLFISSICQLLSTNRAIHNPWLKYDNTCPRRHEKIPSDSWSPILDTHTTLTSFWQKKKSCRDGG
jgi:hypothetical protein